MNYKKYILRLKIHLRSNF